MGVAYIVGGAVPVIPFLLMPVDTALWVAIAATVVSLFAVGYVKAGATGLDRWKSGLEMVVVASIAALIGYAIGKFVGGFFGLTV
jgi:predicted membrane protein (TIGR00267 family)